MTIEDGTHSGSRNVVEKFTLYTAQIPKTKNQYSFHGESLKSSSYWSSTQGPRRIGSSASTLWEPQLSPITSDLYKSWRHLQGTAFYRCTDNECRYYETKKISLKIIKEIKTRDISVLLQVAGLVFTDFSARHSVSIFQSPRRHFVPSKRRKY